MNLEIFLLGLLIVSTLTGLVTEAIKTWLEEHKKATMQIHLPDMWLLYYQSPLAPLMSSWPELL